MINKWVLKSELSQQRGDWDQLCFQQVAGLTVRRWQHVRVSQKQQDRLVWEFAAKQSRSQKWPSSDVTITGIKVGGAAARQGRRNSVTRFNWLPERTNKLNLLDQPALIPLINRNSPGFLGFRVERPGRRKSPKVKFRTTSHSTVGTNWPIYIFSLKPSHACILYFTKQLQL